MKKACVPVCNFAINDNRVIRTSKVLEELGYDVHIMALGNKVLPTKEKVSKNITIHRFMPNLVKSYKKKLGVDPIVGYSNYILKSSQWIMQHNPDILHLNDWDTVPIALASKSFNRRNVIYDMHEFFQDSQSITYPQPVKIIAQKFDLMGLRKSKHVICVSSLIANSLKRYTKKPITVIRNISKNTVNESAGNQEIIDYLKANPFSLIHIGIIRPNRGLSYFLKTMKVLPEKFKLVCLAQKTEDRDEFENLAMQLGLKEQVKIFDVIPAEQVEPTIKYSFAGLSTLLANCRKLDFALPNKLFHYLNAGIPIISSDTRAQSELVQNYRFGKIIELETPHKSAKTIKAMKKRRINYSAVQKAGLTWEQESIKLKAIFEQIETP